MVADKRGRARDISVNTRRSAVTPSGTADSWAEANEAAAIAHSVKGVTQVEDDIRVDKMLKDSAASRLQRALRDR